MPGEALLDWYEAVKRPLPWRFTRDPWAILVSEVMLQQTQAARVVPHYERFLARFPTPAGAGGRAGRRGDRGVERARLQPPRARAAGGGARGGRARLAAARAAGGAARRRAVHGGGARLVRVGTRRSAAVDTNVRRVIERRDGVRRPPRALARRAAELVPDGPRRGLEPGDDGARGDGLPAAAPALRRVPAARRLRGPAGARARRRGRARERFEDTDRWARGRLLAALVAGEAPPALAQERRERALAGLERDGLVVRGPGGEPRLP